MKLWLSIFIAHMVKYEVMGICVSVSLLSTGGGGGGAKIEKCPECHGEHKNCIKFFLHYIPFNQLGVGPKL